MVHRPLTAAVASALAVLSTGAEAKPRVMVLGTYHMANPKRDVVKHEMRDTLSPERQREILAVVGGVKRFRPTRIAVEADPRTAKTNEEYAAYLAGTRALTANETDQIGFRIAKELGHSDLCLFDQPGAYHWNEVRDWMKKSGIDVDADSEQRKQRAEQADRQLTVGEKLAHMNTDEGLRDAHWAELKHIDAGDPADGPGPRLVAEWYERNLRMFARLRACPRSDGERLLVIVGAGHAKLLREFVRDSPDLDFVSPLPYLPKPPKLTRDPPTALRSYADLPAAAGTPAAGAHSGKQ